MKTLSIRFKKYHIIYVILVISLSAILWIVDNVIKTLIINILIISTYVVIKPRYLLHPNNMVFSFFFLFFTLPTSVEIIYEIFNINRELSVNYFSWFDFRLRTYYDILIMYLIMYLSFSALANTEVNTKYNVRKVNYMFIVFLYLSSFVLLFYYLQETGGLSAWLENYKENFIYGRSGLGELNFIVISYINISIFIIGMYVYSKNEFKVTLNILSIILIILASFLQGIKSRLIILLVILYFPYIINFRTKMNKILLNGALFFVLIYIGNYIRSNGFYNSIGKFVEYTTQYFNSFQLHDIIVSRDMPDFGRTIWYIFNKPLIYFGVLDKDTPFDLSIVLTQEYFPADWELLRATQQWPLVTDLYYNFYGLYLGWIPLVLYVFLISKLFNCAKQGNICIAFIYILEFFRIFSTLRGSLLPWQIYLYIPFYCISYFILNKIFVRQVITNNEY